MKRVHVIGIALCAMAPALLFAQAGKVLSEKEVNEQSLVNMLTPDMRTRSIKVTRDGPPPPAPSASLLITFETNSAQLTPQARQSLGVVARALKSDKLSDFRFSIEGHADPRGTEAANLKLSQARAESVVAYLVEQQIDGARLKPVGKGQSELMNVSNPIAPENRRVTIKTLTD
jgi:outer membrane protein OmpA-like peptidoglycan-associated protein